MVVGSNIWGRAHMHLVSIHQKTPHSGIFSGISIKELSFNHSMTHIFCGFKIVFKAVAYLDTLKQPHNHLLTLKVSDKFVSPVNVTCMYLERIQPARREYSKYTQKRS
ncbi:hypothetical protein ILYODFUR_016575 [Ilyodon furcidens]|uniref:Uncharacterized protein n=1 Tax=Ilyodon furcidens TaxID=33524 RepID=A0ABV0V589_9TELE